MLEKDFEKEILEAIDTVDISNNEYVKLDNTLAKLEKIAYAKPYSKLKLKEVIQEELKPRNFKEIKEIVVTLKSLLLDFIDSRNKTLRTITEYRNMMNKIINNTKVSKAVSKVARDFMADLEKLTH